MKSTLFAAILWIIALPSYGQLYPIKNLSFSQWYDTPYNCYTLSWDEPDSSVTDTLIGYNIYRDNSLYGFTTLTTQRCVPCIGDTNTEHCSNFILYNNGYFDIHVTAVYNSSHAESIYIDSAKFVGLAIGINETKKHFSFSISPNPFSISAIINADQVLKNGSYIIYNTLGQQVKRIENINGTSITLNRDKLPSGLYIIKLSQDNKDLIIDKLIITDN